MVEQMTDRWGGVVVTAAEPCDEETVCRTRDRPPAFLIDVQLAVPVLWRFRPGIRSFSWIGASPESVRVRDVRQTGRVASSVPRGDWGDGPARLRDLHALTWENDGVLVPDRETRGRSARRRGCSLTAGPPPIPVPLTRQRTTQPAAMPRACDRRAGWVTGNRR